MREIHLLSMWMANPKSKQWNDVRLLSLTAIKGWKSQHWFIWRVLSPSGPFQALTKITEKDQQDQ